MASLTASTPSPPPSIRTPPTPKHGFSDPWEPYAPRKSARISSQRNHTNTTKPSTNRTPSPQASRRNRTPTRTARKAANSASIMSPTLSPQKKTFPSLDSKRSVAGAGASASAVADSLTVPGKSGTASKDESRSASITQRSGMLPTPVKTPKKAPTEAQTASIQAVARNLFSNDDSGSSSATISTPRKKRVPKKYTGVSMESFAAEEIEQPIQIFTDSQDRVPEIDTSADNPFYTANRGKAPEIGVDAAPEPPRRRSKRKVAVPGEGAQSVDDALQREDGMIYVFRGKKVFRKFAQLDGDDAEGGNFTRSSMKPRRLFQAPKQEPEEIQVTPEEEEAMTDIEEHLAHERDDEDEEEEEIDEDDSYPQTPTAPKFGATHTPPDTRRVLRFGDKSEDATPSRPKNASRNAAQPLFASAPSMRSTSTERAMKRPAADALTGSVSKRARS